MMCKTTDSNTTMRLIIDKTDNKEGINIPPRNVLFAPVWEYKSIFISLPLSCRSVDMSCTGVEYEYIVLIIPPNDY